MTRSFVLLCLSPALLFGACATVREVDGLREHPADGKATVQQDDDLLVYSVATTIAAPPDRIWALLCDAAAYPTWNSTIESITGDIVHDGELVLRAKGIDRDFNLTVTTFEKARHMVWEDGMPMGLFAGVRTFWLLPKDDGSTTFIMSEAFSGGMLGMIADSIPDQRASFEAFAADLKKTAESPAR